MKMSTAAVERGLEALSLGASSTASTLDVTSTLTPLTPEVLAQQATINIGTIGHVAHGKSTVVKAISGVQTVRFKNELERNITIKLGYANAKVPFYAYILENRLLFSMTLNDACVDLQVPERRVQASGMLPLVQVGQGGESAV